MHWRGLNLFAPTDEHRLLAETVHAFVTEEVEPQAAQFNREERFNLALFRRAGELGLLGLTVPESDGGAGLDAVAAVMVHEALSAADPGFCLAYLAHADPVREQLRAQRQSRRSARASCPRRSPANGSAACA